MSGKQNRVFSMYTWHEEYFKAFREISPLAVGVATYGLVFGLLAAQASMSALQTGIMGTLVFAGASQIVAIERIVAGAGAGAALIAGLAINLRLLLIAASVQTELKGRPWWQQAFGIYIASDENWLLMHAMRNRGFEVGYWYLVGGGSCLLVVWIISTVTGVILAGKIPEPTALGLDFAFVAAFIAISRSLWRGNKDILPWSFAIVFTIIVVNLTSLEPSWIVAISGVAGAILAGFSTK